MTFWEKLFIFIREIVSFGLDAFVLVAAREVAKRFWKRLAEKGGAIAGIETTGQPVQLVANSGGGAPQTKLPFLDEYKD